MRIVVTGGRDYHDRSVAFDVLDGLHALELITALAHGNARGADQLADAWARLHGIEPQRFDADWARYKKLGRKNPAGAIRNREMLRAFQPDVVVAFAGGSGTANCVAQAKGLGITVFDVTTMVATTIVVDGKVKR